MTDEPLSYLCPFCGSNARVGSPCPGCPSKKNKPPNPPKKRSWQQDSSADGLNLPDDDFDYDDFVAREFGEKPHHKLGLPWYWWLLGIVVLVGMIFSVF